MPKRPPGVYKRGSTLSVVIERGRDPDTGKRKKVWHSGFATLSEAVAARTRLLRERDTGAAIDPSRQTFAEFVRDEWLPSRATTGRGLDTVMRSQMRFCARLGVLGRFPAPAPT